MIAQGCKPLYEELRKLQEQGSKTVTTEALEISQNWIFEKKHGESGYVFRNPQMSGWEENGAVRNATCPISGMKVVMRDGSVLPFLGIVQKRLDSGNYVIK